MQQKYFIPVALNQFLLNRAATKSMSANVDSIQICEHKVQEQTRDRQGYTAPLSANQELPHSPKQGASVT